ncbi:DUF6611 family protein [Leifsonia aquatica]|uniref:DUF6611 family protein n=1 Tax=Leifsonia aquatica TaxID=144185 RepID=UPI003D30144A
MNEFVRRLTEGHAPWGRKVVRPASPGLWERYPLTIYPPGTPATGRRVLQFVRTWPITGATLAVTTGAALHPGMADRRRRVSSRPLARAESHPRPPESSPSNPGR